MKIMTNLYACKWCMSNSVNLSCLYELMTIERLGKAEVIWQTVLALIRLLMISWKIFLISRKIFVISWKQIFYDIRKSLRDIMKTFHDIKKTFHDIMKSFHDIIKMFHDILKVFMISLNMADTHISEKIFVV